MTTTTTQRPAGSYRQLGPTAAGVRARGRTVLIWAVVLLLAGLALVLVTREGPPERHLDPRSPAPIGSKALAEVLGQQGVSVTIRTSVTELPSTPAPGTTVAVTADNRFDSLQLERLLGRIEGADRLVLLLTDGHLAQFLSPGLDGYEVSAGPTAPAVGCDIPGVRPGDTATGGTVMLLRDEGSGDTASGPPERVDDPELTLCLPTAMAPDGGAMLGHVSATPDRPEIFLVGFANALTNEWITGEDNAALGLRILGASPNLTWIISSAAPAFGPGSGRQDIAWPDWSGPVTLVLAGGIILLALVRGRRLGRVVAEPLPVIVRASETTESRGHLYRRSRDRTRAARILRTATRGRLRRRLGLDRDARLEDLIIAVTAASGQPRERVAELLTDAPPESSAALVTLGTDLADLEGKVALR
ncbi:MAG: DUF4350 domain-containing protein [Actinomycetia bacterium]|nr:DUF4350 domain-containing protein [Actinomycetes bacterium]